MKRDLKRLTINLPSELVESIDRYAYELGVNRTTAIVVLLSASVSKEVNNEN